MKALEQLYLKTPDTKVSLFIEASPAAIARSLKLPVHAVEIHTGDYAKDFIASKPLQRYLDLYLRAHGEIRAAGRGFHAGHGLTDQSLGPLLKQGLFEEYNIGHWIVGEALFTGLETVVAKLSAQLKERV
jgi:pyridoxine 5-phosphate synthase